MPIRSGLELCACDGEPRTTRGVATVVVFCPDWPGSASEALRAELRGLGATLVVILPDGGILLRPDDAPERLEPAPAMWERYGATAERPLFLLLDADGQVRLRRLLERDTDAHRTLLGAMREAGRSFRHSPRGVSRRELLVSTL